MHKHKELKYWKILSKGTIWFKKIGIFDNEKLKKCEKYYIPN